MGRRPRLDTVQPVAGGESFFRSFGLRSELGVISTASTTAAIVVVDDDDNDSCCCSSMKRIVLGERNVGGGCG